MDLYRGDGGVISDATKMRFRARLLALILIGLLATSGAARCGFAAETVKPTDSAANPTNPLWHEQKVKNYLPDMTWPEVQDLLSRSDLVIIPVGALEQHSLQGPIGTDFLNSTEEAKLIAQRTDVLVTAERMPMGPGDFDRHAGVGETSMSLYLTPTLVDLSAAKGATLTYPPHLQAMLPKVVAGDPTANLVFLAETLKAKSTGKHTSTREMSNTGSWSVLDPKTATAERGCDETERFVSSAVKFIDAWKQLRPLRTP
jgi:creatinine amidohydrolase/Fe(II)-dependent formamide hydrolase-like protein